MFKPEDLDKIPQELVQLYSDLETDILHEIIRRIKSAGEITRTADYQIKKLYELGASKKLIKKLIKQVLEMSNKEIDKIYSEAIKKGYTADKSLYDATGNDFIPYEENEPLQDLIDAIKMQTKDELYNITQTTGFMVYENGQKVFKPIAKYLQDTLDRYAHEVINGTLDYNTAIKNAVKELTKSGIRHVDYASGRSYSVEWVVRTTLLTGVNQVASKISDMHAEELETEYFEVTAHGTARPSHQVWQGKVYTKEELVSICGLGDVAGLCGANCRHNYYPFIPGVSTRAYTDEQLEEMIKKDNTPKKYGDKEYTAYEATQRQRELERRMRRRKQSIALLKEGGASEEEITNEKVKYMATSREYAKFSKAMGLPEQRQRILNYQKPKEKAEVKQQLYYTDDKGQRHNVDGHKVILKPSKRELEVAYLLKDYMSKTVNVMPRVNTPWNISSPDYIIDNDKYDLKEINEGGKNTLDNAIAKSRKQATNFVFDITNAKLSEEETYSQIERIYESQFRKWVEKIIVIKNNEILKKFKR